MVEEKSAANLVAALLSCSMDQQSSGMATQFKNLNITNLISPTTIVPKVIPSVSDPSSMINMEQVKRMMEEQEVL